MLLRCVQTNHYRRKLRHLNCNHICSLFWIGNFCTFVVCPDSAARLGIGVLLNFLHSCAWSWIASLYIFRFAQGIANWGISQLQLLTCIVPYELYFWICPDNALPLKTQKPLMYNHCDLVPGTRHYTFPDKALQLKAEALLRYDHRLSLIWGGSLYTFRPGQCTTSTNWSTSQFY